MDKYDRALRIINWAKRRYMVNASITISVGGYPTRYSKIEDLACSKLLGCRPIWAELTLADALPHHCDYWPALRALEAQRAAA